MKILLATPVYPPEIGGPATYTVEIVERLHNNHDIKIVALADNPKVLDGASLTTISKKQRIWTRLWKTYKAILKEGKDRDVIYVQNALAAGFPAVLAGKKLGKPVLIKFVGDEAWERSKQYGYTKKRLDEFHEAPEVEGTLRIKLMKKLQGWTFRNAHLVTTPSEYLKTVLVKHYGLHPDKCIVNYNAIRQKEDFDVDYSDVQKKAHQLVATARLVNWKGIDGIVKAVALLKEDIPDIHFVIAGDGPEEENIKKLIKELGVEKHVTMLGRVSRVETRKLRKESELYILNSTYEGLPHTVLTSFSAEIPVIATNIGGTNEAVYDGETGLLVEPNNPEGLADAIKKLLDNEELQQKFIINGTQLLRDKFSWDAHIKQLEDILSSLIN